MLFVATAVLVAMVGAARAQDQAKCPSSFVQKEGYGFVDPSPLRTIEDVITSDACCHKCSQNDECEAFTFSASTLFRDSKCVLHSSSSLEQKKNQHDTAGSSSTPPSPSPSPTPTPSPPPGEIENWVVIAAGSSSFMNYRHQADACHAYQVAKSNGIPESNIILMMQDDVASSSENPFPGKLFNRPTAKGTPGVDVYDGCKVDYRGEVVTAQLFLDVLTGNKAAVKGKSADGSDKVLASTKNDRVFVNFVDHGGAGIVAFPNGPYLDAKDLVDTLETMAKNDKFYQLVFYMEACESGSMFENLLPTDLNIFVTTASNAEESSWGTYCPPQDVVDGTSIGSCLGDLYSVNWMEDSDTKKGMDGTLDQQYEAVKTLTNKSHVMEYGSVGTFDKSEPVSDFQSHTSSSANDVNAKLGNVLASSSDVSSRDIGIVTAFYKYLRNPNPVAAEELVGHIRDRENADVLFPKLVKTVATSVAPVVSSAERTQDTLATCRKAVYSAVANHCGGFDEYSLKYSHSVVALCETRDASDVIGAIVALCEDL